MKTRDRDPFNSSPSEWRWLRTSAILLATVSLAGCGVNATVVNQSEQVVDMESTGGPDTIHGMAERFAAEGNHTAAIPLYRQAVKNNPFSARPLVGLGESLIAIGRYVEGAEVLRKAVEDEDDDPRALKALGNAYLALGQPELALANFNRSITLGGGQAKAISGAGVALDMMGRHSDALEAHRDASAASSDPDIVGNHALSLAIHGDADAAIAMLEPMAGHAGTDPAHRQNLALAYVLSGDERKAFQMASVDLDAESARRTVHYFRLLRGMAPMDRMRVLVVAGQEPDWTLEQDGNLVIGGDADRKAAAAERVVTEPVPAPEPEPIPEPEPEPEPLNEPLPNVPPLMEPEGWAVQIGAYRGLDELVRGWDILSERYADIIGDLEPRRSEVDFGDRGSEPSGFFYRLNAGPLRDYEQAADICDRLKERNAPCWIRPPEPAEGRLPAENADSNGES